MLRTWFFILLFLGLATTARSQQYHAVIGAFAKETNAKKFTGYARKQYLDATYRLNPARQLYYVFVLVTANREEAYTQAVRLQSETEFKDAWVFYGTLGATAEQTVPLSVTRTTDTAPVTITETKTPPETNPIEDSPPQLIAVESEDSLAVSENVSRKPVGKFFTFRITSAEGRMIPGEIHYVDRQQGRDIATYRTNEVLDIRKPSEERPMTLVCGIFGYKEVVKNMDYNNPGNTAGASLQPDGSWLVTYELEPLKKGDVTVMYSVSFYKDAVVMTPASKQELDQLADLMQTNTAYRIKIHGHTNGNYNKRKIIALGKNENYFDMRGSDERNGSSKELSKLRAQAVQDYLATKGIAKNRSELFAWGGTNMLVSETSTSARLNDRIEIEILAD